MLTSLKLVFTCCYLNMIIFAAMIIADRIPLYNVALYFLFAILIAKAMQDGSESYQRGIFTIINVAVALICATSLVQ